MNQEAIEKLNEILSREKESYTEEDKGFLMARRDYLTEEQRFGLSELLGGSEEAEEILKKSKRKSPLKKANNF